MQGKGNKKREIKRQKRRKWLTAQKFQQVLLGFKIKAK